MEYNLYKKTNDFIQTIDNYCFNLSYDDKNIIVNEFKKLNWEGLYIYYEQTNRKNLLNLSFIIWKILTTSNKFNFDKNICDNIDIKKYNNGLQNMLWEILNPDMMELS